MFNFSLQDMLIFMWTGVENKEIIHQCSGLKTTTERIVSHFDQKVKVLFNSLSFNNSSKLFGM